MDFQLDKGFEEFLASRNIETTLFDYLREQKIDCHVVALMDDAQLKELFPSYGDRIAIRDFCKKQTPASQRKQSLLDRLRNKLGSKKKRYVSSSEEEEESKKSTKKLNYVSNTNSKVKNSHRLVEIGWLHNPDGKEFRQVRSRNGGGTRKIRIRKTAKKRDLIEEGKKLFFPNGESAKGLQLSKFTVNLLDFSGKPLDEDITIESVFEQAKLTRLRVYLSTNTKCETITTGEYETSQSIVTANEKSSTDDVYCELPPLPQTQLADVNLNINNDRSENNIYDFDANYDLQEFLSFPNRLTEDADSLLAIQLQEAEADYNQNIFERSNPIKLHRGQVFYELIELFLGKEEICKIIQVQLVLPNGEIEAAEDCGGVWRDALSEFWETMIEKCTIGTNVKIPQLRHDFGYRKWLAIGKILKKGWLSEKYFPIRLSKLFMENCIFKKPFGNLRGEFLQFVSEEEREILTDAIKDFDAVDKDELIDVLGRFDCKTLPNAQNLPRILDEIADKEIIQKPAFVADCFHEVIDHMISLEELDTVYKMCKPTSKNILSLLRFEDALTPDRDRVSGFLKKFIRDIDEKLRRSFLRFSTGSDIVLGEEIKINFISTSGLQRSPIAHTCSNTLQVPDTYDSYIELRSELTCLLNSNIWVMDII